MMHKLKQNHSHISLAGEKSNLQRLSSQLFLYNYKSETKHNSTMDTADLTPLVEDLESNIDDLEAALKPLLDAPLSTTTATLPVLDRAKLFVLITYAIESLIFSHVRLTGADGKAHPVFTELQRVKQYFEKIEKAENPIGKRENLSLNKPAAGRFIKAALAGNIKFDQEQEERKMREAQGAKAKLDALMKKRKAEEIEGMEESSSSEDDSSDVEEAGQQKKKRTTASDMIDKDTKSEKKKSKKSREKHGERKSSGEVDEASLLGAEQKTKKRKKKSKKQKDED
jgi:exosome complex protein LRP1